MRLISRILITILIIIGISCDNYENNPVLIKVKINDSLFHEKITGRLIFLFDKDTSQQLLFGVHPDNPQPVYTYDIENWNPKDTIIIKEFKDEWFRSFKDLSGEYAYRLFLDVNNTERSPFVAAGNAYSGKQKVDFTPANKPVQTIELNNKFEGWKFNEKNNIREIKYGSELLSDFWQKDIHIEAAIVLTEGYYKANTNYKVVYVFPGFGSSHCSVTYGTGQIDRYGMNTIGEPKIFVFMNAEFFQGYHHFADSENNGPWAKAFTQEFIPHLENSLGLNPDQTQRFLMGQSSGAWTALWLQLNYPDIFNHAFAASPDPIDFRAHGFNIYHANANYYLPEYANEREIEKANKTKLYAQLEDVTAEYGQIGSWEASFSPKATNGSPALLFDRKTGNIDAKVVQYWSKYDICKLICDNPQKYKEIVSKKFHIFVSIDDPYQLYKSVEMFQNALRDANLKADIQYFNGLKHNVWTDDLRFYIHNIIDKKPD